MADYPTEQLQILQQIEAERNKVESERIKVEEAKVALAQEKIAVDKKKAKLAEESKVFIVKHLFPNDWKFEIVTICFMEALVLCNIFGRK